MSDVTDMTVDRDLAGMMTAVFSATETHFEQAAAWDAGLWRQLGELGLTRLTGPEEDGGSGAGWPEAAALLSAAASRAVRVPLAEHDLLACWLLSAAGLPAADGARRTVCVVNEEGAATAVPWASSAERIVLAWKSGDAYRVAEVEASRCEITPGHNLAREPRDDARADLSDLDGAPVDAAVIELLGLRGALARGLQVCAVLDRIVELSVRHATERVQFGRPLARFQAVQHEIADAAAEAALARAATEAALAEAVRTEWGSATLTFRIAAARSCAGHAASVVVRNAHQVHGAIGTTLEHELHKYTLLALAWRSEYGSVRHWDEVVTAAALEAGADGLWPLLALDLPAWKHPCRGRHGAPEEGGALPRCAASGQGRCPAPVRTSRSGTPVQQHDRGPLPSHLRAR